MPIHPKMAAKKAPELSFLSPETPFGIGVSGEGSHFWASGSGFTVNNV